MAGIIKHRSFSEGVNVDPPMNLALHASDIAVFADDASYVTQYGGPVDGSVYINSTDKKIRYYATAWRDVLPATDLSDNTKSLGLSLSGNTTGKKATLLFAATDNRTYTFPDASTTLVGHNTTQSISSKTLIAPLLDTSGGSGSFDVSAANPVYLFASAGANDIYVGGATSTIYANGAIYVTKTSRFLDTASFVKEIRLRDPGVSGTNYVTIKSPTLSAGYTLTLPVDGGTNGYAIVTNGSGVLSYSAILSNPMSSAGQMIYGGSLGVATALTAGATDTILRGGSTPSFGFLTNNNVDAAAAIAGTKVSPNFGSQAITTTGDISGAKATLSTGLFLPTSGGTAAQLDFYEELTSHSVTFTGAVSTSGSVRLLRIGKIVVLAVGNNAFTSSGNNTVVMSTLPSRFRPTADVYFGIKKSVGGGGNATPAQATVGSNGVVTYYLDMAQASFSNGITYTINNHMLTWSLI